MVIQRINIVYNYTYTYVYFCHFIYKGSKGKDGTKKEDLFTVAAFQEHSGMQSGSVDMLLHKVCTVAILTLSTYARYSCVTWPWDGGSSQENIPGWTTCLALHYMGLVRTLAIRKLHYVQPVTRALHSAVHMPCVFVLLGHYSAVFICKTKFFPVTHTGCPRRNVPDFGRVFLMLKYTDITQNTYVQSWTVTEIMAREKCGLLAVPRTVPGSRDVIPILCALSVLVYSRLKRIPRCDCTCKVLGNPKDNYDISASVFVVQFNGFMSLTS